MNHDGQSVGGLVQRRVLLYVDVAMVICMCVCLSVSV